MPKVVKMVKKEEPAEPATKPAKVKNEPAAKPAKVEKGEKKSRRPRIAGKTTGMGVQAYQNQSLEQNMREHLTDEALAKWRDEFPTAVKFTEKTVRGVRSLYNRGKHGNEIPKKVNRPFDENGNPMPLRGEKKTEKTEKK